MAHLPLGMLWFVAHVVVPHCAIYRGYSIRRFWLRLPSRLSPLIFDHGNRQPMF
jgi:hypothetical protein